MELRLQNHIQGKSVDMQEDKSTGKKRKIDFKSKWLVKKAVELLIKQYMVVRGRLASGLKSFRREKHTGTSTGIVVVHIV